MRHFHSSHFLAKFPRQPAPAPAPPAATEAAAPPCAAQLLADAEQAAKKTRKKRARVASEAWLNYCLLGGLLLAACKQNFLVETNPNAVAAAPGQPGQKPAATATR